MTLLFFGIACIRLQAQHWEVGAGLGASNYRGDLAPNMTLSNMSVGSHIFGKYNFNEVWALRFGFMFMRIKGSDIGVNDPIAKARNYSFRNSVTEFYVAGEYNFQNFRNVTERIKLTPFFTAGLGYFRYNDYEYVPSGKGLDNICVPFGVGFKYALTSHLNLNGEFIANKTFTQYIDNLAEDTPAYINAHIKGDNPSINDWFFYTGLSISYIFTKVECPAMFEY